MHNLITSMLMLQAFEFANGTSAHIIIQCLPKRLLPHCHSEFHLCIHIKTGIQSNSTASYVCHLSLTMVDTLVSFSLSSVSEASTH